METVPAPSAGDAVALWSGRRSSQALRAVTHTRQPRGSDGNVGVPFPLGEQRQLMNKAVEPKWEAADGEKWIRKEETVPETSLPVSRAEKQRVVGSSPGVGKTWEEFC